jgi:hypothetical protein
MPDYGIHTRSIDPVAAQILAANYALQARLDDLERKIAGTS